MILIKTSNLVIYWENEDDDNTHPVPDTYGLSPNNRRIPPPDPLKGDRLSSPEIALHQLYSIDRIKTYNIPLEGLGGGVSNV